jgi:hypothetical protein
MASLERSSSETSDKAVGRPATASGIAVGRRAGVGLVIFLLVAFGVPTLLRCGTHPEYDPTAIDAINRDAPEFVFLGNSLLETRIDPEYLSTLLAGRKAVSLAVPSTESAAWYLQLKNVVAASDAPVRTVFIFFHKDMITRPLEGLDGRNRDVIAGLLSADDADYSRVIEQNRSVHDWMLAALAGAYPLQNLNGAALDRMSELAAFALPSSREQLSNLAEDTFAAHNQREPGIELRPAEPVRPLDSSISSSFLPLMLDIARERGIKLVFVRVQERPNVDGSVRETLAMREYSRELADYLDAAGAGYVDFTGNASLDRAMYYDSFHIRQRYLTDYTDLFYREMSAYFEDAGNMAR